MSSKSSKQRNEHVDRCEIPNRAEGRGINIFQSIDQMKGDEVSGNFETLLRGFSCDVHRNSLNRWTWINTIRHGVNFRFDVTHSLDCRQSMAFPMECSIATNEAIRTNKVHCSPFSRFCFEFSTMKQMQNKGRMKSKWTFIQQKATGIDTFSSATASRSRENCTPN